MNTNKEVEWRFIVPKKVEQTNDYLFIDKSNNIKIGVNDMTVNDSEMSVRWKRQAWSIPFSMAEKRTCILSLHGSDGTRPTTTDTREL